MLAAEETTITLGKAQVTLRPTLRAAMRLERRYGFGELFSKVQETSLGVISDLVHESTVNEIGDFEEALRSAPLAHVVILGESLLAHVIALTGLDPEKIRDTENETSSTPKATFADHLQRLFEIGTGWLGWEPATVWNATPAEIMAAYNGRQQLLKSIFGGNEAEKPTLSLAEKAKLALARFNVAKAS